MFHQQSGKMTSTFQFSAPSLPQHDRHEQHPRTTPYATHQQCQKTLDFRSPEAETSFTTQDWGFSYNEPSYSTPDVVNSTQRSQINNDPLVGIGSPTFYQAAANDVPLNTLLKPAAEAWRPPALIPLPGYLSNVRYTDQHDGYTRSTGVMTEPLLEVETSSYLESELASNFDSELYFQPPTFRQELTRDDQSEISATSGAYPASSSTRPPAVRVPSNGQIIRQHDRRRRSSQPLPVCSHCKAFQPKNNSDQTYVCHPRPNKTLSLSKHSKHERKHTKPFKCRFDECIAKDVGFSTENDRDRHYKSGKHNEAPTKGSLKGFICAACRSDSKWWSRQDNFRAHCKRKHTTWDIDDLVKRYVWSNCLLL
jgi:hypothetical protein